MASLRDMWEFSLNAENVTRRQVRYTWEKNLQEIRVKLQWMLLTNYGVRQPHY